MTTKLDKGFANGILEGVNALILEVERLEGELEKIEKILDPYPSPGGDTVWLVDNAFKNLTDEIARLKKECGEQ